LFAAFWDAAWDWGGEMEIPACAGMTGGVRDAAADRFREIPACAGMTGGAAMTEGAASAEAGYCTKSVTA